ncbi:unnamed protein product [Bursaphelenchus okinawaensis]|uniref:Uncharacterized protein n=1 Tax=Bursaphelenchus okinawaensis TaxID=465554 RepID=A0A811L776_9BILA|nr:unnamed protein product [Bursaphelenchus okinawaensis]CAG9117115.1 unnamed protein product [Bursaphelenchus okinawaensis]
MGYGRIRYETVNYIIVHHLLFKVTFKPPSVEYNKILSNHDQNLDWYIVADLRSVNAVWAHFLSFQTVVSFSYTVNIWFGYKIVKFLKEQSGGMSAKTLKAQKTITYVLFVQSSLVQPSPAQLSPAQFSPAQPSPVQSSPAQSSLVHSNAVQPIPAQPSPVLSSSIFSLLQTSLL